MAKRRMFSLDIVDTDAFLDMPISTQALYFHLGMRADDDGFVSSPKKVMNSCKATADDMNVLIAKKFIIDFENGIIVIKHWKMNNYIQADRYSNTNYAEEKGLLELDENKAYRLVETPCIQNGYKLDTQVSIGKVSIGKSNNPPIIYPPSEEENAPQKPTKRFVKPTVEEIKEYCTQRNNNVDANQFYDFYESKGWVVGKAPMKDWKAAVRTWESNRNKQNNNTKNQDPSMWDDYDK